VHKGGVSDLRMFAFRQMPWYLGLIRLSYLSCNEAVWFGNFMLKIIILK
jgi:hypothetical protein